MWTHQEVTKKQWSKLDQIISLVESTSFWYDIIIVLHRGARYFQEVKNPRNCLPMRRTYEEIKLRLEEEGIPQHLKHI